MTVQLAVTLRPSYMASGAVCSLATDMVALKFCHSPVVWTAVATLRSVPSLTFSAMPLGALICAVKK